jgi:hypothetical protein
MGENVDNEYQKETYVNVNLVPLEEKFDTTTTLLTYEIFWKNKMIKLKLLRQIFEPFRL